MLLVGSLDFVKSQSGHWAQAILFLVWCVGARLRLLTAADVVACRRFFFYGSTQGPIPYAVASEVSRRALIRKFQRRRLRTTLDVMY